MVAGGQPGKKFCPTCQKILDTNVQTEKTTNTTVHGLQAKQREIKCTFCESTWVTVEVILSELNDLLSSKR